MQPHLVFLDEKCQKMDGFDVIEALGPRLAVRQVPAPLFCFVTAYPQFATDAFETGALDFLCKPVRLAASSGPWSVPELPSMNEKRPAGSISFRVSSRS